MTLRGVKPSKIEKRLKMFIYGAAGVGKTYASIQFPKPYLIDTEKGAQNDQYVSILEKNEGAIFSCYDFDELITEIKALLTMKHDFRTLIIDPLTTLYNNLLDKSAETLRRSSKERDATGTEFGRHYAEANKKMKHLLSLLMRLDMNIIITAHSKNEYAGNMVVIGETFDCYKKLDYLFDLVLKIQKYEKKRTAVITKTRIEGFPELEIIPFNYDEIANRYGRSSVEKEATPIELASKEDVVELTHLIELLKIPNETIDKWLAKSQSESFDEMNKEDIIKCINYLKDKIKLTGETKDAI